MGFLKRFFKNVFHEGGATSVNNSSFDHLSEEELEAHLGVDRYGDFCLTGAVRPSYDLRVVPAQGYRNDVYRDDESRADVPVLMAAGAVAAERLAGKGRVLRWIRPAELPETAVSGATRKLLLLS